MEHPIRPFHPGELAVHQKRGVVQEAIDTNEMDVLEPFLFEIVCLSITPVIPHLPPVRPFVNPHWNGWLRVHRAVYVSSVSSEGALTSSALFGPPGFVQLRTVQHVRIDARPNPGDPLAANLVKGAHIALLLIEFETRKRFRINGLVSERDDDGFVVHVEEACPNCPKYIQKRTPEAVLDPSPSAPLPSSTSSTLSPDQEALIKQADTFFLATRHPTIGCDESHRGGRPGFVRVLSPASLLWPDYKGNNLFMTLGNLTVNPLCSLLFIDFETGAALQVQGYATLDYDNAYKYDLAATNILLKITSVRSLPGYSPLRLKLLQPSPHNPALNDPLLPRCNSSVSSPTSASLLITVLQSATRQLSPSL